MPYPIDFDAELATVGVSNVVVGLSGFGYTGSYIFSQVGVVNNIVAKQYGLVYAERRCTMGAMCLYIDVDMYVYKYLLVEKSIIFYMYAQNKVHQCPLPESRTHIRRVYNESTTVNLYCACSPE
jgi:hypothetical protein